MPDSMIGSSRWSRITSASAAISARPRSALAAASASKAAISPGVALPSAIFFRIAAARFTSTMRSGAFNAYIDPGRPQLARLIWAASTALLRPSMGPSQNSARSCAERAKGQPLVYLKWRVLSSRSPSVWLRNEHLPPEPLLASTQWPAAHKRSRNSLTSATPFTSTLPRSATDKVCSQRSMRSHRPWSISDCGYDL